MPIRKLGTGNSYTVVCVNEHPDETIEPSTMKKSAQQHGIPYGDLTVMHPVHCYRCTVCGYIELYGWP